jgi:hypothetical protein
MRNIMDAEEEKIKALVRALASENSEEVEEAGAALADYDERAVVPLIE